MDVEGPMKYFKASHSRATIQERRRRDENELIARENLRIYHRICDANKKDEYLSFLD